VASASAVGGKDWNYFSGVCWYFGRNLYDKLQVPIGLISNNWGGTLVEQWSSPDVISKCHSSVDPKFYSVLYHAMITPYFNMRIKGFTWYQGESNVPVYKEYGCLFQNMITDWRVKFNQQFSFHFVQLAAYTQAAPQNSDLAEMRFVQADTTSKVSLTGMASAVDLGDFSNNPYGNIHPRNKQDVGFRLSLAARAITYKENIVFSGPVATTAAATSSNPVRVQVSFDSKTLSQGLISIIHSCDPGDISQCSWYEILLSDGRWYNATAAITATKDRVEISLSRSGTARGVRYGFSNWPVMNLYNSDKLPALPFRIQF